ncbi:hypothetical protein EPUL_005003 [Erysiphe pulchra]|uniref:Uncharacterized protein n=1 Tax=Erysiphe pulchra TaxID=225359 RepID=A0A2S4PNA9_9PEZI|nr:hypothetical protein EPUL_005003 [Erysiphe pulchra]
MGYATWPILPMEFTPEPISHVWRRAMYQIVFDANGKVTDMIVRLANNQFAKCWRVDSQQTEASIYSVEESNGYKCGYEFIPDNTLTECTRIARKNLGMGHHYPLLYSGNLYSDDLGYRIWPIYYRDSKIHRYPNAPRSGSFFIVIDSAGQLNDVIARTSRNNFIRCMRARKVSPAPDSDELSQIFAKPPRNGYMCDKEFFDDNDLQIALKAAQRMIATKRSLSYPKTYVGEPFDSSCLLWPLNKNGRSYMTGRVDKYRLVLTLELKIMCVAMEGKEKLVPCERRFIRGGYPVRNSYRCYSEFFSHEELASTAEVACRMGKRSKKKTYPAIYQGLEFDVEGPYLIYPIKANKFSPKPGVHRLVINTLCHIAGVLTMDPNTKELVKCSVEGQEALQES